MEDQRVRKVLDLALLAGQIQLSNGAEVWRAESTVKYVCTAYGVDDVDAFVMSTAIFLTGNYEGQDVYAKVKHIPLSSVHLKIVTAVNDLSREIAEGNVPLEEAIARLEEIQKIPEISDRYKTIASAFGAGFFIYILGAGLMESIIAGVIGGMACLFSLVNDRKRLSKLVKNIFGGAFVALAAYLITRIPVFASLDINKIIIGGTIPLIPGAAFVNSIRDIANADFLSGTVRILDTLMVFVYLAVGACALLAVCKGLMGGM